MQSRNRFYAHKVDVRGLSRKEAAMKRRSEYRAWQLHWQLIDHIRDEENREERNAWKVRSYKANKERQ